MSGRGFTLLELAVVAAILTVLLGTAFTSMARDKEVTQAILAPLGPELRAQNAMERMAAELRMAGPWGEDQDHDGLLDPGEDTNGNGRLDADWNLPDETLGQDHLAFNRRIDERDLWGNVLSSGIYSRRVSYLLDGEKLVREWQYTDSSGGTVTRRAVMARQIRGLRFSRRDKVVRIELEVPDPGRASTRVLRTQVLLRN